MPPPHERSCPTDARTLLDLYFLEHRARLIDVAAFLDRLDRASDGPGTAAADFRVRAMRDAIDVLSETSPGRARRVLEVFSDPTDEPIPAAGDKGACGAVERD